LQFDATVVGFVGGPPQGGERCGGSVDSTQHTSLGGELFGAGDEHDGTARSANDGSGDGMDPPAVEATSARGTDDDQAAGCGVVDELIVWPVGADADDRREVRPALPDA